MPPMTTTGDISYRTAGYFSKQLLERSQPLLVLDKFGQPKPLPAHSTRTIKFRGYEHLPNQPKALIEGVTPQASKPTFKDIEATINQYGDWIELTDVLADTHEDPLISEFSDILGEQAAIMRERITAGVVLGGTNVFFSGETAGAQATNRNGVNKPLTLELQRRVTRMLKRQLAMPITSFVSASPNFKTESVLPSYVAICHTDCEADIREMRGFLDVKDYGGGDKPMPGEIGSVEGVRYMCTTVFEPWADAGAAGNGVLS
ncbi:N4-gp56 family major capsid protein, partial [uncultured Bilophila sp.]|uniref:N4-gp56 family major capsid protein n=1 Tax=uncultured Bilophila sp. TaxID=529385 RepID=UPI00280B0ED7